MQNVARRRRRNELGFKLKLNANKEKREAGRGRGIECGTNNTARTTETREANGKGEKSGRQEKRGS